MELVGKQSCLMDQESHSILQSQRSGLASAQLHVLNSRLEFAEQHENNKNWAFIVPNNLLAFAKPSFH